jgi:hypothetical protein
MRQADLAFFKSWFKQYVSEFYSTAGNGLDAIVLKEKHTERTCREIVSLGRELGLSEQDLMLAETSALFHDIGRFSQWSRYGTFVDSESENHAALGLKVLSRHKVLERLTAAEREGVQESIRHHNQREVPGGIPPRLLFFVRLLRDADKLDVWRVVIHHAENDDVPQGGFLTGGVPAGVSWSPAIMADLRRQIPPEQSSVRNQNDLFLLRLGWIFDLNFAQSCRRVLERHYIERLCRQLPASRDIQDLQQRLLSYLKKRLEQSHPFQGTSSIPRSVDRF